MFEYIVGKINYLNSTYVILENNFIGYKIYVSNPNKFELNKIQKLYIYPKLYQNNKSCYVCEYYGFKTLPEKIFFESLLNVNGIGVKSAIGILKNDLSLLKNLIKNNDIDSLINLEGINNKIANNLVMFLSIKLKNESLNENITSNDYSLLLNDVISALKSLGYKKTDIEKSILKLDKKLLKNYSEENVSELISLCIKNILNYENISN